MEKSLIKRIQSKDYKYNPTSIKTTQLVLYTQESSKTLLAAFALNSKFQYNMKGQENYNCIKKPKIEALSKNLFKFARR